MSERGATLGSTTWDAAVAVDAACRLGEGPWWDAPRERLLWVDIEDGLLHAYLPACGETATVALGEPVGFVVGREGGGFVVGAASGLVALDDELRPLGHVATPPDLLDGRCRLNDGVCDPAGRVLLGSVAPGGALAGTLWRWSPVDGFAALARDVGMSNGLAFSPDGRWLYYVDTAIQSVDRFAYDVETGTASRRTPFQCVPASAGMPDGLAVDAEGCVWVALWGAGEVWRLSPEGERVGTLRAAASRTSCCAFGGPARDRLYVTSARAGGADTELDRVGAPGALFVADVGVAGAPVWAAAV